MPMGFQPRNALAPRPTRRRSGAGGAFRFVRCGRRRLDRGPRRSPDYVEIAWDAAMAARLFEREASCIGRLRS